MSENEASSPDPGFSEPPIAHETRPHAISGADRDMGHEQALVDRIRIMRSLLVGFTRTQDTG
eukprot:COSAG01_NODE_8003_length_2957_cov_2.178796_2_plen_62_part_00